MNAKHEIKSLRDSFKFALSGFLYCVNNERNVRIHISVTLLLSLFSYYYGLNRTQYMIFALVCGLVIFAEMMNTSIEAVVNLVSPSYHQLAKVAKDVAAGAVLLAALVAVIVGVILFGDLHRLLAALELLLANPIRMAGFAVLFVLLLVFIFKGSGMISKLKNK